MIIYCGQKNFTDKEIKELADKLDDLINKTTNKYAAPVIPIDLFSKMKQNKAAIPALEKYKDILKQIVEKQEERNQKIKECRDALGEKIAEKLEKEINELAKEINDLNNNQKLRQLEKVLEVMPEFPASHAPPAPPIPSFKR